MKAKKRGRNPIEIDLPRLDKIKIPFSIFHNSNLTVFEALVRFLKEEHNLTFKEIASLLNRDERNIWTIYQRTKIKT